MVQAQGRESQKKPQHAYTQAKMKYPSRCPTGPESSYAKAIGFNKRLVWLAGHHDREIGTPMQAYKDLLVVHFALEKMRNALPERRKRLVAIHGLSIPELEALRRRYAERYLLAKQRGIAGFNSDKIEKGIELKRDNEAFGDSRAKSVDRLEAMRRTIRKTHPLKKTLDK